jgi:putative hydrolase of the HAD superfamily
VTGDCVQEDIFLKKKMAIDLLLFDLDGTLYDQSCGYEDEVHSNIFKFMAESKGGKFDDISSVEEAEIVWGPIFDKYNLTKRGLLGEGYIFDSVEYDTFVRKGASKYFKHDPDLRLFLESLPQRKVIFTNAPESSANEILKLLGVADLFEAVLGTEFMQNKVCKPEREAFQMVLDHLGVSSQHYDRVCYFEDSFKNLQAGKEIGFQTVFVKSATLSNEGVSENELSHFDAVMEGKVGMGLKSQMPSLWDCSPPIESQTFALPN